MIDFLRCLTSGCILCVFNIVFDSQRLSMKSRVCVPVPSCISSVSLAMANLMHLGLMTIRVLPLTLSADNFTIPLSVLTKMLQYGMILHVQCNHFVSVIVCELLV